MVATAPQSNTSPWTTLQCFRHYASTLPKGNEKARYPLQQFMRVGTAATRRWINQDMIPKQGLSLVRLQYFLDLHDYKVAELETLMPEVKKLGQLIVLEIIPLEEILLLLEISEAELQDLFVNRAPGEALLQKIKDTIQAYKKPLEYTINEIRSGLVQPGSSATQIIQTVEVPKATTNKEIKKPTVDMLIETTARLLVALQPLLKTFMYDLGPEERKQLRDATKQLGYQLFDASNNLDALCSEKALAISLFNKRKNNQ